MRWGVLGLCGSCCGQVQGACLALQGMACTHSHSAIHPPSLPASQIGTGVMVGLPGQTLRDLAGDVMFFRDLGADMIGMVGATRGCDACLQDCCSAVHLPCARVQSFAVASSGANSTCGPVLLCMHACLPACTVLLTWLHPCMHAPVAGPLHH